MKKWAQIMIKAKLITHIINRDFKSTVHLEPGHYKHPHDLLMIAQASFFMGETKQLQKVIQHIKTKRQDINWLLPVIDAFRFVEIKEKRAQALIELIHVKEQIATYPQLLGDFYFTLGLLFGQLNQRKLSSESMLKAINYFEQYGLIAHSWYAHFNFYLAKRNIGEHTHYQKQRKKITTLLNKIPRSTQVRPKWFLSELLFTENKTKEAYHCLTEAIEIAKGSCDDIQVYECLIELYYMEYIAGTQPSLPPIADDLKHRVYTLYRQLKKLIESKHSSSQILRTWAEMNLHPLLVHRLIHIYLHQKTLLNKPIELLDDISYIEKHLIQRELYIPLYDLDFYKARCYLMLNDTEKTLLAINQIEINNKHLISPLFRDNYEELIALLNQNKESPYKPNITLDLNQHILYINNKIINLSRLEIIEKALDVLINHKKGIEIDLFFKKIYEVDYSISRHESRFNSLLARLRSLFPHKKFITRRANKIKLSYYNKVTLQNSHLKSKIQLRLEKIIDALEAANGPKDALTLHKELDIPLRTLQKNLSVMLDQKIITKVKKGRKYYYSLNRDQHTLGKVR